MNKKLSTSLVASLLLATNLLSYELDEITVSSSMLETTELNASFATEIFTKKDIESTNSKTVYDFLSSQTSVAVLPNYGNTFSQKIDLRGYGIGDGYQNIVVMVNGRKLNNIDMSSQLLSSIPLDSVEKIEIVKGSGSVLYGDGANAGIINIITNSKYSSYIKSYMGDNGQKHGTLSLGLNSDMFIFNSLIDYTSTDGSRVLSTGETDENYNKNKIFNLIYLPTDSLEINLTRTYSNSETNYGGPLTLSQYNSNPNQASYFTNQEFRSYVTSLGLNYYVNNNVSFETSVNDENKLSKYSSGYTSNYDYRSLLSKLNIKNDDTKVVLGIDKFDGSVTTTYSSKTTKDNTGFFTSIDHNLNKNITLNAGIRKENVNYTYSTLEKEADLNAYDLGINYKLDDNNSLFANYNKSFQAPDINRFFRYGTFNGFIEPAKVDNYTIGFNNINKQNKLKISAFRSELKNEIYYYHTADYSVEYNTNIDKSHKYGVEVFDKFLITDKLYTSINYSYIIAKIDEENEASGAYNGKYLPGVSKHNATINLGYNTKDTNLVLSHTYRSKAYAANDFENNFTQKQEAYNSTDLSATYKYQNIEFFGQVQNVFDETNGIWISDDTIYPVNFERTYYLGMKVNF